MVPLVSHPFALLISAFKLDFYAQVQDLSYLIDHLNKSHRTKRYAALTAAICELIEDFGLVSFECLAVEVNRCRTI
jgi:GPN-loop GTPase